MNIITHVTDEYTDFRLDSFLNIVTGEEISRTFLQKLIKDGFVSQNPQNNKKPLNFWVALFCPGSGRASVIIYYSRLLSSRSSFSSSTVIPAFLGTLQFGHQTIKVKPLFFKSNAIGKKAFGSSKCA